MKIIKDEIFEESFKDILKYISKDSKIKASRFNIQISKKILKLPNMPFKFRKSFYFEDENVRDMIFKGYTLPYLVDIEKDTLVLLDIFKWKSREILE